MGQLPSQRDNPVECSKGVTGGSRLTGEVREPDPSAPESAAAISTDDAGQTTAPYTRPVGAEHGGWLAGATGQRYQVRQLHRQGGLGAVWLAHDTLLGRDVALKSIRPDRTATSDQIARFVLEARVTSQLEHPCIVPLYDLIPPDDAGTESAASGVDAMRGPRYVMRFVTGQTLADAAKEYRRKREHGAATRLELIALLDAFVAVCRAIAYAHSRGVLHRDLKGLNVVLGGFGEVFLLDWGLAKTAVDQVALTPAQGDARNTDGNCDPTQAGTLVGTPAFMAPEVASGQSATKLSDVYGLGAVLFEILTGRSPHGGSSVAEVLSRVTAGDPPLVREANPAAPPALEAICRKAMARSPSDRYASAEDLSVDVRRWLADEPVAAYREPWPARIARWARQRKTTVVALGVLLLTVAIASSVAAMMVWREQKQTALEKFRATQNANAAIEVVRDLSKYVYSAELSQGRANRTDDQRKAQLNAALASYERLLALYPEDTEVHLNVARLNRLRANLSRFLAETSDAEKFYADAKRHYAQLAAAYPTEAAIREESVQTSRDFGQYLQTLGRFKDGAKILDDSIHIYEKLYQSEPSNYGYQRLLANMLIDRADLEYQLGQFAASQQTARRSADLYAELGKTPSARLEVLDTLFRGMAERWEAMAIREQGQIPKSVAAFDIVVERLAALVKLSADRNTVFQFHQAQAERAWTLARMADRRAEGAADLDVAIAGFAKLSEQFPQAPVYSQWLGTSTLYRGRMKVLLGQHAAAAQDLKVASKILDEMVKNHPDIPVYRYWLGQSWMSLGQLADGPAESAPLYLKARQMLEGAVQQNPESFQYRRALEELDGLTTAIKP